MAFGENFVRLRREAGLTQVSIGLQLGVGQATVSKWERNKALPESHLLPKLAALLETTIDAMFASGTEPARSSAGGQSTDAVEGAAVRRAEELRKENARLHSLIDKIAGFVAERQLAATDKKGEQAGRNMSGVRRVPRSPR